MERVRVWSSGISLPVYTAALLAGSVGAMFIAPLGLVVPEWAVWLMTLVFGAQIGALAASWASNLMASGGSRADIVQTTIGSWVVGLVVGLGTLAIYGGPSPRVVNLALTLVIYMALIAIPVSMLTVNLRGSQRPARTDLLLTIGLVALGLALVGGATAVVCTVSTCGA